MATCSSSPWLLKLRAISHGCVVPRTWRHRVKCAAACFPLPNVHKHRAFVGECNCGKHGCCVEMLTWWPRRACRGRTKTVSCSCFFSPLLQHVGASSLEVLKARLEGQPDLVVGNPVQGPGTRCSLRSLTNHTTLRLFGSNIFEFCLQWLNQYSYLCLSFGYFVNHKH